MDSTQYSNIWWNSITGPSRLIQQVSTSLRNNCHNVIVMPHDLPWRWDMRFSVENQLSGLGLSVEYIDCEDEYCDLTQSVEDFILHKFASDDVYLGYRPYSGESIQSYMLKNHILDGKIIWLKGMNKEQNSRILDFCRQFKSNSTQQGLFVIETIETTFKKLPSCIVIHNCREYITKYDTLLFDTLVAANLPLCNLWQQYVARVVASLCVEDAEISTELIENVDFTKEQPLEGLQRIFEEKYSDGKRGTVQAAGDKHPFLLLREKDVDTLNYRVWQAQLEIAFPLIEEERLAYIHIHKKSLEDCLAKAGDVAYRFGSQIINPQDVELGLMVHLTQQRDAAGRRLLPISSEEDYQRILFLHQQRNILAHMGQCSTWALDKLFCGNILK